APDASDRAQTSGLALAGGFGYQTPSMGAQADYYLLPDGWPLGLVGYVGAGWWPPPVVNGAKGDATVGLAVGASAFVGHRHRFVLDLSYGLASIELYSMGGIAVGQTNVYGMTAALGYEYLAHDGFLFRASLGLSYLIGDALSPSDSRMVPTGSLAF